MLMTAARHNAIHTITIPRRRLVLRRIICFSVVRSETDEVESVPQWVSKGHRYLGYAPQVQGLAQEPSIDDGHAHKVAHGLAVAGDAGGLSITRTAVPSPRRNPQRQQRILNPMA